MLPFFFVSIIINVKTKFEQLNNVEETEKYNINNTNCNLSNNIDNTNDAIKVNGDGDNEISIGNNDDLVQAIVGRIRSAFNQDKQISSASAEEKVGRG